MPSRFQSRGWRRCRRLFRGIRVLVLLAVLFLIGAGYYLNQIGLPDFLKRPLLRTLQARGVDFKFSRLRWRYYRGLVAENVRFGQADALTNAPSLSAREVELKLNHTALRHFQITVDSVILHGGTLAWPVNETNQPFRKLSIDDIQTQLRFLTNDLWELDRFTANFAGASLDVSLEVSNAPALRDWKIFQPAAQPAAPPARLRDRLRQLADTLDRIKFHDTPEFKLFLSGDAREPQSFAGRLTVRTSAAETPLGSLTNGYLIAHLVPARVAGGPLHGNFELRAGSADTRWGSTEKLQLHVEAAADPSQTNLVNCRLQLSADRFTTAWAKATNIQLTAEWAHALTNRMPLSGHAAVRLADPFTTWGQAGELLLEARLGAPPAGRPRQADAGWAWWADLEPCLLDWNCRLHELRARDFQVKEIAFGGSWQAPELTITNLHSELYGGRLDLEAALNVATRALRFSGRSDFDPHSIAPLLTEGARKQLADYAWEQPPLAAGRGAVILPAWTNRQPDWAGEVAPTLSLEADISSGPAAFRQVWAQAARLHLSYSNQVLNIPDFVAPGTNGRVQLQIIDDNRTHNYYFHVRSDMDIQPLRKLLEGEPARQVFDSLVLTQPPVIDAEIWGRWHDLDSIGIRAQLALTNFTLRGESATNLQTRLYYTNRCFLFDHPRVGRGVQYASADSVGVNFTTKQLFLTNGFSTIDPMALLHIIGPKVTKVMEPYQFGQPPTVHASGIIPLDGSVAAKMRFDVDGGPFRWNQFNLAHVSGGADWVGDHLALSGMQTEFYGGRLNGSADFDFPPGESNPFTFDATVTGANLGRIMAGLLTPSNHLEGTFNGRLTITRANTDDWKSWFGQGAVDLHDGLIWDIPIFGVFSKVLNTFVPGAGDSRANEGAATFVITNSVLRTEDLKIRSPVVNMIYRGTSDFDGRVDAVVEAQVLRNAPLFGRLISGVFSPITKLFEYKVTGTLGEPKAVPLWLPTKLLTMPFELLFHPVNSLKSAFPGTPANTNAPPVFKLPPDQAP